MAGDFSENDFFPGLKTYQLTSTISWRFYKHWGQGYRAGENMHDVNGDRSGCIHMFEGLGWTNIPCVVQARLYTSEKGTISAVFSYPSPHGIGYSLGYFWEIMDLAVGGDSIQRFDTEEEMERRIIELLGVF